MFPSNRTQGISDIKCYYSLRTAVVCLIFMNPIHDLIASTVDFPAPKSYCPRDKFAAVRVASVSVHLMNSLSTFSAMSSIRVEDMQIAVAANKDK